MSPMRTLFATLWRWDRKAFRRGALLSAIVLLMGVALLALSGWFITAAAAAGLAGTGAVFNVFAPSAMVRFLALTRTAARYGERVTTHDATLAALSGLRIQLLQGLLAAPYRVAERMRSGIVLNRVTADVDALDGLALRLVLPGLAGGIAVLVAALTVGLLVHPALGAVLLVGHGLLPTLGFMLWRKALARSARRAEIGLHALRARMIDLLNLREDLTAFGQIPAQRAHVGKALDYHGAARRSLDRLDRRSGMALDVLGGTVVAVTLGAGLWLAQAKHILPAQAAIAIFAALALTEAVAPIRRALAEIGRMQAAARRVAPMLASAPPAPGPCTPVAELTVTGARILRPGTKIPLFEGVSFTAASGQTVALTGPSGGGKSSLLLALAGMTALDDGIIAYSAPNGGALTGVSDIAMVPQRHALVAGTIADNLRLAAPSADDGTLWAALEAASLADTVRRKGGLQARLGFRGAGLSGGEGRRLALARAVLCAPSILLLDEPTEGLNGALAAEVLTGLRTALPEAIFILASHRAEEIACADMVIPIGA